MGTDNVVTGRFALVARCLDLCEAHIVDAIATREGTKDLLGHLAQISAPDAGAAKALLVCARMATNACDWLDGDLTIDLVSAPEGTLLETATELGGGLRERLFAPMAFKTPLDEFARAMSRVPHMIAPLAVQSSTIRRIRLRASEIVRRTTAPPPPISISAESLFVRVPAAGGTPFEAAAFADDELPLPIVGPQRAAVGAPLLPAAPLPVTAKTTSEPSPDAFDAGWDE